MDILLWIFTVFIVILNVGPRTLPCGVLPTNIIGINVVCFILYLTMKYLLYISQLVICCIKLFSYMSVLVVDIQKSLIILRAGPSICMIALPQVVDRVGLGITTMLAIFPCVVSWWHAIKYHRDMSYAFIKNFAWKSFNN